jgi:type VII secretion-associated serine protease mycosin
LRSTAAAVTALVATGLSATPATAAPDNPSVQSPQTAQTGQTAHTTQLPWAEAVRPATAPLRGDSVRAEQWHLKTLNVAGAWAYATGEGVTVAVIDSGVDAGHVDLAGQVLKGVDMVSYPGDARTDLVGHGTTVAALIAGRGDDDAGVVGIAPKAKILPVRVLDQQNRYDDALIVAKAVRWAVDNGAQVINLSLGGNGSSAALAAALDYAFAKDVVVVACTGNAGASGSADVWYPAREPGVIAVTGMERDGDVLWPGSISGRQTVVAAPATQLVGARPSDAYWRVQGTSFAAPMVSGTAALIRSRWPAMSAAEVINRIIRTAEDRGLPGRDDEYGFGMVDPTGALTDDVAPVSRNPLDTAPPPGVSRFGNAPAAGQAQSAPDNPTGTVRARASGANAGWAIGEGPPAAPRSGNDWWAAALLFVLSAAVWLFTIRRFGGLA